MLKISDEILKYQSSLACFKRYISDTYINDKILLNFQSKSLLLEYLNKNGFSIFYDWFTKSTKSLKSE